ncbi:hypothetical protein ACRRTK_019995 [Alexandromys fortis]
MNANTQLFFSFSLLCRSQASGWFHPQWAGLATSVNLIKATRRRGRRLPRFPELAERGSELNLGVQLHLLPHCGHRVTGRLVLRLPCLPLKL